MKIRSVFWLVVLTALILPVVVVAQDTGVITGTVHDNNGAIEYRVATLG